MTSSDSTIDRQAEPAAAAGSAAAAGPGRIIRLAREKASLGVDELAKLTRLSRATLDALERDDFTALGEPVYVRGYYRKCSKALSLSEGELISAYERLVVPKAPQAPTKLLIGSGETRFGKGRRGQWRWLVWVLLLGAVLGAGARFVRSLPGYSFTLRPAAANSAASGSPAAADAGAPAAAPNASTAPAAEPPAAPAAAPAEGAGAAPAQPAAAVPPAASGPVQAPGGTAAAAPVASQASTVAPGAGAPAAAANAATLELSFKSASWVRVEDSSGAVLLSGTVQAGNQQSVSGKPPYSLFIGNAPGVSVVFGGKAVDLQPYIKQNDTARFTLPASAGG